MTPTSFPSADPAILKARTRDILQRSIDLKHRLLDGDHVDGLVAMADICARAVASGGKLMFCGNGGSAADAQHLAAELTVRLRSHVDRDAIPALTLAMDTSSITACANDYGFEHLYERMQRALGRPGDVLIGITTSGKSPNVRAALRAAHELEITTLGFLGGDGGPALTECDLALVPPSTETGRIQEAHITAGHALVEMIEDILLATGTIKPRS